MEQEWAAYSFDYPLVVTLNTFSMSFSMSLETPLEDTLIIFLKAISIISST